MISISNVMKRNLHIHESYDETMFGVLAAERSGPLQVFPIGLFALIDILGFNIS